MTWSDIKNTALQLMFSYSANGTVSTTTSTFRDDWIKAMPPIANIALRDLASVCPIRRRLVIKHYEEENIVSTTTDDMYVDDDDIGTSDQVILLEATDGKSFYCEVDGAATINFEYIEDDDSVIVLESESVDYDVMTPVRYIFTQGTDVQVRITGNVRVQNFAFYERVYTDEAYIPSPGDYQYHSISALITAQSQLAFYKFDEKPIRLGKRDISGYVNYDGLDILTVPTDLTDGEIYVYYLAYPTTITSSTDDSAEIELPNEAADLIPYYIASVLYVDDDMNIASLYRNEYYTRRNAIVKPTEFLAPDEFINMTGW